MRCTARRVRAQWVLIGVSPPTIGQDSLAHSYVSTNVYGRSQSPRDDLWAHILPTLSPPECCNGPERIPIDRGGCGIPKQGARTVARCGLLQRTYHQYPIAQRLRPAQANRRPTPAYRLTPRRVAHIPPAYADALIKMEKRLRQYQPSPASGD